MRANSKKHSPRARMGALHRTDWNKFKTDRGGPLHAGANTCCITINCGGHPSRF